jgi:hypothetical protein
VTLFQPIPIVTRKEARAPISAKTAEFEKQRQNLLNKLRRGSRTNPLDETASWRELCRLAELYFRIDVSAAMSSTELRKRLGTLADALRKARNLMDRALNDDAGNYLYRAWCAKNGIQLNSTVPIELDGSSALTRGVDEIKEMTTALAKLEEVAHAAAASDKAVTAGRPALLPRDCIQDLARVYRKSTGSKPGLGAGPFADFAYEFMTAVGQTGFSRRSLIDAMQDAHRLFKPSWFDGKPPSK